MKESLQSISFSFELSRSNQLHEKYESEKKKAKKQIKTESFQQ